MKKTLEKRQTLQHYKICVHYFLKGITNNARFTFKATSHTRMRARDHYTSRNLIGGKGGADPSLLHTTLEGPTEYMNARWM